MLWGLQFSASAQETRIAQLESLTLKQEAVCDPIDGGPPGSPAGILQARTLEWVAISFSRESSLSKNKTRVSCIVGRFFTTEA